MKRLTKATDGKKVWINPEHIVDFGGRSENRTWITTSVDKVLEWRLAMEDYRIFTKRGASDGDYDMANSSRITLESLTGLEEPNND